MDVACGMLHPEGDRCQTPATTVVEVLGILVPCCGHCIEPGAVERVPVDAVVEDED